MVEIRYNKKAKENKKQKQIKSTKTPRYLTTDFIQLQCIVFGSVFLYQVVEHALTVKDNSVIF